MKLPVDTTAGVFADLGQHGKLSKYLISEQWLILSGRPQCEESADFVLCRLCLPQRRMSPLSSSLCSVRLPACCRCSASNTCRSLLALECGALCLAGVRCFAGNSVGGHRSSKSVWCCSSTVGGPRGSVCCPCFCPAGCPCSLLVAYYLLRASGLSVRALHPGDGLMRAC